MVYDWLKKHAAAELEEAYRSAATCATLWAYCSEKKKAPGCLTGPPNKKVGFWPELAAAKLR